MAGEEGPFEPAGSFYFQEQGKTSSPRQCMLPLQHCVPLSQSFVIASLKTPLSSVVIAPVLAGLPCLRRRPFSWCCQARSGVVPARRHPASVIYFFLVSALPIS